MKKTFIMAAALAIAATFASCEKEPTALKPENLNGKATICGFVQIQTYKEDSKALVANDLEPMADQQITVLYGTDTDGKGNYTYTEYNATTNRDGYYTIDLPVAIGKQIDDVKVQLKLFKEQATYGWYGDPSDPTFIRTDAWFQAEANAAAPAGQTIVLDLLLEPVEGTSHANLHLK